MRDWLSAGLEVMGLILVIVFGYVAGGWQGSVLLFVAGLCVIGGLAMDTDL